MDQRNEHQPHEPKLDSQNFGWYLLGVLRNRNFLQAYEKYPNHIDPYGFEPLLEEVRESTAKHPDYYEHISIMVADENQIDLTRPYISSGEQGRISGLVIQEQIEQLKKDGGSTELGKVLIHSHPRPSMYGSKDAAAGPLKPLLRQARKLRFNSGEGLSVSDLYPLVYGEQYIPMTFVVEPASTLLVCASRETQSLKELNPSAKLSQHDFSKSWYEIAGWTYEGADENGEHAHSNNSTVTHEDIIKAACRGHKLLYYKGLAGQRMRKQI